MITKNRIEFLKLFSKKYAARSWLRDDGRYSTFRSAIRFINYEMITGDVLEFGVGNGKSLAMLALLHQENLAQDSHTDNLTFSRRFVGLDSFSCLPADTYHHPRWWNGLFSTNYDSTHPFLKLFDKIDINVVEILFSLCKINIKLHLEKIWFNQLSPNVIPNKYNKIALLHIDCDLYDSTYQVLHSVEPALQSGCMLLFDDWFCYQANPHKGEAKAFRDFLYAYPYWQAIHYRTYATHCNAFILYDSRCHL